MKLKKISKSLILFLIILGLIPGLRLSARELPAKLWAETNSVETTPGKSGEEESPQAAPLLLSVDLLVSSELFTIEKALKTPENQLYLPLKSENLQRLIRSLGGEAGWEEKEKKLTFSLNNQKFSLKAGEEQAKIREEEVSAPLILFKNEPYLSISSLELLLNSRAVFEPEKNLYYFDPLICVRLKHREGGFYHLLVTAESPIRMESFILKEPARFVVDIPNAVLQNKENRLMHPDAGEINFAQFAGKPNQVRVVIPLSEKVVVKALNRVNLKEVEVEIKLPPLYAPGQNFAPQKLTELRIEELEGETKIWLKFSGAVQYEWHRLRCPDNRLFIDFAQTTLDFPNQKIPTSHPYLSEIRVGQFQQKPLAIARVVLQFSQPAGVEFERSEKLQNLLLVRVKKALIDPEAAILRGVGSTGFPLKGLVICIDPGHGGSDPGAVNYALDILEKDLTLDLCFRLSKLLSGWGWNVVLTRYDDRDVSYQGSTAREELGARCRVANDMKAQLFLSIHCNSSVNTGLTGTSLHWFKQSDQALARELAQSLKNNQLKCRGLSRDRFYVLAHTRMPAVLIECGYMSNSREGKLLNTPAFRQAIVEDIAQGLKQYQVER